MARAENAKKCQKTFPFDLPADMARLYQAGMRLGFSVF
jgi:hypothetical protein